MAEMMTRDELAKFVEQKTGIRMIVGPIEYGKNPEEEIARCVHRRGAGVFAYSAIKFDQPKVGGNQQYEKIDGTFWAAVSGVECPEIVVEMDFDGYFEQLSRAIVAEASLEGRKFWCDKLVVTAGPWRTQALAVYAKREEKTATFDFYSALRTGFGNLTLEDCVAAGKLLLEE